MDGYFYQVLFSSFSLILDYIMPSTEKYDVSQWPNSLSQADLHRGNRKKCINNKQYVAC